MAGNPEKNPATGPRRPCPAASHRIRRQEGHMNTAPAEFTPGQQQAPVIRATALTKRYGRNFAVNQIDLEIPAGRIIGLIGPNGAGKTTLIKAILGLTTYD